jgi:anti-sigma regulatory factor (Ser/Thr protein kinase)
VTGFSHEVLLHSDEERFTAGVLHFVHEGLARDEAVVVVEPRPRLDLLRDAMGNDASAVSWLDMLEIGGNPGRILPVWADAVAEHVTAPGARGLRGVGEPAFRGRRLPELAECAVHERLLNTAFADGPAWRLLCPYDETALPADVVAASLRTHPVHLSPGGTVTVPDDQPAGPARRRRPHADPPLPPPTDVVLRGDFGPGDVPAVRRTVRQYARSCGLAEDRVEALELAASELAANSVRHGGGRGSIALWREPDGAVLEFTDAGRIVDPLTGRRRPAPGQEGGMGLYLVHQLCDLVQVRSGPEGTVVRVTTWL